MPENWQIAGFGIYLHWPFCEAKCPYCDFNSHVARWIDHDAWCSAYLEELESAARETGDRVVRSVFFGGGTPSLMEPRIVATVLKRMEGLWTFANDVEITLEANPSSVEAARFADLRRAGINRVSLGVQALDDEDLKRLGRLHSVADSLTAIDVALGTFDRVSIDLMYGRQDQTPEDWDKELRTALGFDLTHMSLYQLTIEPETAFGERYAAGKLRGLPDEDRGLRLFETTYALCESAGLTAYEVSNFAKTGQQSRHNLIYWRSGDYVGIGPGAHGRVTLNGDRLATEHERAPQNWLQGPRETVREVLSQSAQQQETLLMGLRLHEGIDLSRLRGFDLARIRDLVSEGWLETDNDSVRVTAQGQPMLNAILERLLR